MSEFSLLSLNTFGLPFYLGLGRLKRLARELNHSDASVICLQEVAQNDYAALLQRSLTSYPHHVDERLRHAPKGGLEIFSRLPAAHPRFEVYQDRGVWHSIGIADWATYKGILSVTFDVGGMPVIVMNTHMHANYYGVWRPSNLLSGILRSQVRQVNQAIHALPQEALVIICGDLNFPRNSFLYQELIEPNNLLDPLAEDPRPTYRPFPLVPSKWKTSLDYALIRPPARKNIHVEADVIEVEDTLRKMPIQRFLTDHNALTLQIGWDSVDP